MFCLKPFLALGPSYHGLSDLPLSALSATSSTVNLSLTFNSPSFLCHEQTKLIPISRCLHLSDPLSAMPLLQIAMWLLLIQLLCLTSNITPLKRTSLTTYSFPHSFVNYCIFIFLPKTAQNLERYYLCVFACLLSTNSNILWYLIAMILSLSSLYPQHLEQCLTFNRHSIWIEYTNKLLFNILCF